MVMLVKGCKTQLGRIKKFWRSQQHANHQSSFPLDRLAQRLSYETGGSKGKLLQNQSYWLFLDDPTWSPGSSAGMPSWKAVEGQRHGVWPQVLMLMLPKRTQPNPTLKALLLQMEGQTDILGPLKRSSKTHNLTYVAVLPEMFQSNGNLRSKSNKSRMWHAMTAPGLFKKAYIIKSRKEKNGGEFSKLKEMKEA